MTGLDLFALIVLLVLFATILAVWGLLGILPGKIARQRNHPQADAIGVCGWIGAITMGIFSPIAFIWAYSNPAATLIGEPILGAPAPKLVDADAKQEETPA